MEIILGLILIVLVGVVIYYNRSAKKLDLNNDGKVNVEDVKIAVENTVSGVVETADANKDGKVDVEDVKVVAEKVKTTAKKAAAKTKKAAAATVTKKPGRKPKAK